VGSLLNLLRAEWIKLRYNISYGVVLLAMALFVYWYSGNRFGDTASWKAEFMTLHLGEFVFKNTMGDAGVTTLITIFLTPILIGSAFSGRTINDAIYAGHSRLRIFTVKMLFFYLATCLVSILYPVISILRYSRDWLHSLPPGEAVAYIWRCLGMHVLLDMALVYLCLIVVFACRDVIRSVAYSLVLTLALAIIFRLLRSLAPETWVSKLINLYPTSQMKAVMETQVEVSTIVIAVITGLFFISASITISYWLFRRADLD
jgi:hypothetical protein